MEKSWEIEKFVFVQEEHYNVYTALQVVTDLRRCMDEY